MEVVRPEADQDQEEHTDGECGEPRAAAPQWGSLRAGTSSAALAAILKYR